jgi:hypothetical protein
METAGNAALRNEEQIAGPKHKRGPCGVAIIACSKMGTADMNERQEEPGKANRSTVIVELIKVCVLGAVLYVAFEKARVPAAMWGSLKLLAAGALCGIAYSAGRCLATMYAQAWRNYLAVFYGVGIFTVLVWASYGTHIEDADPIRGGGERVVDFVPSDVERAEYGLTVFVSLLIPAILGVSNWREQQSLS